MADDEGGFVLGTIRPAIDPSAPPLFTVHKPGDYQVPDAEKCQHAAFRLDVTWMTVHCKMCEEKLEPFAVLLAYAGWYAKLERMAHDLRLERIDTLRHQLDALKDRVALTDADRAEIHKAVAWTRMHAKESDLRELKDRMQQKVRDAKGARRKKRRGNGNPG